MRCVLSAVIWKNLLLRWNHWVQTLLEIAIPLSMMLMVNLVFPAINFGLRDASVEIYKNNSGRVIHQHNEKIIYNPSNSYTDSFMSNVSVISGYKKSSIKPGNLSGDVPYTFGVEFYQLEDSINQSLLNFAIYPHGYYWPFNFPLWSNKLNLVPSYTSVLLGSFPDLLNSLGMTYASAWSDETTTMQTIQLRSMQFLNDEPSLYSSMVILAILFAYSFLVAPAITRIVDEKASGAKELMLMMGVRRWELWLAKLVDAMLVVIIVVTGLVIFMYVPLTTDSPVLHHVNPLTFWFILAAGMLAVVFFLFFFSCLFDNSTFAALCAVVLGLASLVIANVVQYVEVAKWQALLYCLLPHMTLVYGSQILLQFEFFGKKVRWFEQLSRSDSELCLADIVKMVIVDITIYAILTWYLDKIKPGKFGVPQPFGFFLKKSYWVQSKSVQPNMPKPNEGQQSGISVINLQKVFRARGRPTVVAVDNISMEIPVGGVTALLGHNGAGKSTTMSIITGLIPATSGNVLINGYDVLKNPELARKSLGLCPQQDLLFADLTSIQILTFFGMVKGLSRIDARKEGLHLLKLLKMENATNTRTQYLSGGTKRKISLGIALIGGSSVVILDEPTSGVDPELRREICDLLLTFRGKRTILLTTHIMEEADAVSDKIIILDHGRIQCTGTPLDLKTRFGTGYTLSVVISASGDDKLLTKKIKEIIPGTRHKPRNAATMTFQLPESRASDFPKLFEYLDIVKLAGDISSYSVSISTLEDVFVRVREIEKEETDRDEDEVDASPYHVLRSNCELSESKHIGCALLLSQLAALFIKKWIEISRSLLEFVIFVMIPVALIVLELFISPKIAEWTSPAAGKHEMPGYVNYSASLYPSTEIFVASAPNCTICNAIADAFTEIAAVRGFRVTSSQNISADVEEVFQKDYHQYARYLIMAVNFTTTQVEIIYNVLATHAVPVALDLVHNAARKGVHGEGSFVSALNLSFVSEKPDYDYVSSQYDERDSSVQDLSGIQTLFYMSALLLETSHGAKTLQLMAVHPALYWISHLVCDLLSFLPYILLMLGLFAAGKADDLVFDHGGHLFIAVIFWGTGLILISYLITCFTKSKANAIIIGLFIYAVFSLCVIPAVQLKMLPTWVGYLHPNCIWKLGLQKNGTASEGLYLLDLFLYSLALYLFLCFYDSRIAGRVIHYIANSMCRRVEWNSVIEDDSDVGREAVAVTEQWNKNESPRNMLLVHNLRRWFGVFRRRPAVRGVSFRALPGECFGLLGVNGAGKSTTFNMLTAQIPQSDGDVKLNLKLLSSWRTEPYLSYISYCPQSSGIISVMNGRQFLELFTRLRGFKAAQVDDTVRSWLNALDLQESADRQCGGYSGGTERKLSAAVAFLWDSSVVMLDEPTSGVDPVARRCIWKAVTAAQKLGKAVILTSHSMDECEALCSRLAIMVSGSFRCIGETATLKNKFGAGYSVQMKLGVGTQEENEQFQQAVKDILGSGCRLTDQHCSILHYHISDGAINWRTLFAKLEELKQTFSIFESYMASETTLEEIFLSFAGRKRGLGNVESARALCLKKALRELRWRRIDAIINY